MSEYSSFFNSVVDGAGIYDREYNAEDFAEYFASFIGNGVYADRASELQVSAYGGNMSVIVPTGSAWINGYYYKNASDKNLTLTIADGALNRTDLIVVRLDLLERKITAEIVEGIPDTQGTIPELTRDADIWEIALASVSVPANATEISQANITDLRADSTYCGWVSGVIDQIDTSGLFAQFTDEFNTWFDQMKGQLSTDAAGHLQQEIDGLESDINTKIGTTDISSVGDGTITGAVSALNTGLIDGMGAKLLWSGNFTGSGSITISGLSDWLIVGYTMYSSLTNIEYLMIGTPSRGGLPYGVYDSTSTTTAAYRFLVSGDTITVNSANRGLYFSSSTTYNNGNETHIYHIFGIIKKPTSI